MYKHESLLKSNEAQQVVTVTKTSVSFAITSITICKQFFLIFLLFFCLPLNVLLQNLTDYTLFSFISFSISKVLLCFTSVRVNSEHSSGQPPTLNTLWLGGVTLTPH